MVIVLVMVIMQHDFVLIIFMSMGQAKFSSNMV
jgi:hypothetical protein